MKIVLDTNVLISSFLGGLPKEIVDLWKTGEFRLVLSGEIFEEYILALEAQQGRGDLIKEIPLFSFERRQGSPLPGGRVQD